MRDAREGGGSGRRLRDAPLAGAAVHPDVLDPEVGALVHGVLGALGPGPDDDAVDATGDLAQVVVAAVALDGVRIRVDCEDLITPLAQALVDDVAAVVLGRARDSGHGDSLAGQELCRCVFDALHLTPPCDDKRMLKRGARTRIGLRTDRSWDELPILHAVPAPVRHLRAARDDRVDWRVGKDVVHRPAHVRDHGGPERAIGGQPRVVEGSLKAADEALPRSPMSPLPACMRSSRVWLPQLSEYVGGPPVTSAQ